jgi:hypothetical protein
MNRHGFIWERWVWINKVLEKCLFSGDQTGVMLVLGSEQISKTGRIRIFMTNLWKQTAGGGKLSWLWYFVKMSSLPSLFFFFFLEKESLFQKFAFSSAALRLIGYTPRLLNFNFIVLVDLTWAELYGEDYQQQIDVFVWKTKSKKRTMKKAKNKKIKEKKSRKFAPK